MSAGGSGGGGIGRREVAVRCFAAEYDDATLEYSESDEERAPNYVVTPTGARVNRLFVVGVLTEVEPVSDDVLRARVVDPTGAFVVYAGQYQPDAKSFLERAEPPEFVAVTGKARTFEPDDADVVYTSIRPESINAVDPDTRDRWTVQTAEFTVERVAACAAALEREERGVALQEALLAADVDPALAAGIPRAIDHYGTTGAYLAAVRETALQAAEVVAGERDEVDPMAVAPDEGGEADVDLAGDVEIEAAAVAGGGPSAETSAARGGEGGAEATAEEGATVEAGGAEPEADVEQEPETVAGSGATTEAVESDGEAASSAEGGGPDDEPDDLGDFDDYGADATEADAEASGAAHDAAEGAASATADTEPAAGDEMYEMDDAERQAVEEEYGTDFTTGSEVDEPGEAGIETPGPVDEGEVHEDEGGDDGAGTAAPAEGPATDEAADSPEDETDDVASAAPAAPEDEAAAPGDEAGFETAEAEGQTDADDGGAAGEVADEEAVADEGGEEAEADEATEEAVAEDADEDVDLEDAVVDAMGELDEGEGADREAVVERVADERGADPEAVEDAIQGALMSGRCYEPQDGRLKAI